MKSRVHLIRLFILTFFLISGTIHLNAQVANFSLSLNKGCAPLSGVVIKDLSTGGTTYDWDFGNGNKSTTAGNQLASYTNPGKYIVKLTLNGGSTHYDTVTVFANPVANYIISSPAMPACVGQTITFTSTSTAGSGTITNWSWDFNDGTSQNTTAGTVTHIYTSPKTSAISLIVTDNNGCSGNSSSSPGTKPVVTILASPKAVFTATPLSSCTAPLTVTFTNTSTAAGTATYLWNFGDATTSAAVTPPPHLYTALGTYPVKLVVTQGTCKDSSTKSVIIKSVVADFTANKTTVCIGDTVKFTDASAPLSTSRTWNFGDATTSAIANPTHVYAAIGTYTVKLDATVTTAAGTCSNAVTKTDYINVVPLPVASFTASATQSCAVPFTVTFNNTSTGSATYLWDFGDGATSSTTNIHTYTAPGKYTVKLTVTSASGCKSTITKTSYITITLPTAKFTATPREGCIPLKVTFKSNSISALEPVTTYIWTFGNGTTKTTTTDTTSTLYPLEGMYTVKLVIVTASGCRDSVTYTNYIKAGTKPKANFNVVNPVECYGKKVTFDDLSTGADSAYWNFGDGTLPTLLPHTPVDHFYELQPNPLPNIYTVQLIVYNKGCPDTITKPLLVTINAPKPVFTIKPVDCKKPYLREFTSASIGADSLRWDFGDGTPILYDSIAPKHTYLTTGLKSIKLTAINKTTGCSYTVPMTVTITDPVAAFTSALKGCYPFLVTFVNTSVDAVKYDWSFGDGTPNEITLTPKPHTYKLPGVYNAQLIITDVNGCKDTVSKKINVQGPKPAFTADTTKGCTPLLVKFTDLTVADSLLSQWSWDFGDGTTATVKTPVTTHVYTVPGAYTVTLTAKDTNGCTSTVSKAKYIVPTFPNPKFTAKSLACKGEVISFNAAATTVSGAAPLFEWTFGDGTTGTGKTPTHAYTKDSLYTVTLKVTDENGCDSTITQTILIQAPAVAFSHLVLTEGCGFTNVQFTDASTGSSINKWVWDFGDGATANIQNPTHNYTTSGVFSVKLTVSNSAGCNNTLTLDSLLVVPGPVGTFSFTPKSGCKPFTVTFTANSKNSTNYTWDFGDGIVVSDTAKTIQHTYTQDITATPILILSSTLTNGTLCQIPAPTAGSVSVASILFVDIDSTVITLDEDESAVLSSTIKGTSASSVYSWTPPTALSCTDCASPTVTGNGSDGTYTYYLTISDAGGCKSYDSVVIHFPKCSNDKFFIPNVFTPNGDEINDVFDITGLCARNDYKLTIFNNWGTEMFSTNDRNKSWNGKMMKNGLDAASGVYYYVLIMDGKAHKGFIHLIR